MGALRVPVSLSLFFVIYDNVKWMNGWNAGTGTGRELYMYSPRPLLKRRKPTICCTALGVRGLL